MVTLRLTMTLDCEGGGTRNEKGRRIAPATLSVHPGNPGGSQAKAY